MSNGVRTGPVFMLLLAAAVMGCSQEHAGAQQVRAGIDRGPGNVRPLSEALALVRRIAPGKVIDVELESDVSLDDEAREPRWVYEIEVLTDDNRVVELEIDALSLQLLEIEGAPWPTDIPKPAP